MNRLDLCESSIRARLLLHGIGDCSGGIHALIMGLPYLVP